MARFNEWDTSVVYKYMDIWRDKSLRDGSSLLWPSDTIWTVSNLDAFKKCFVENMDESNESFENKLKEQLKNQAREVIQLTCELVYIYLLFTSSITYRRKKELLKTIASYGYDLLLDDNNVALTALENGIGGPGIAFNTRRYYEIAYLAKAAHAILQQPSGERVKLLQNHIEVRALLDELKEESNPLTRHILLHLLFPDQYERMASSGHKHQIVASFLDILNSDDNVHDDMDDRIFAIRSRLKLLTEEDDIDFYRSPIKECWDHRDHEDDFLPIQGLKIKKQVVLYGPPGTGKTYEAKDLAEKFIRQAALKQLGAGKFFNQANDINKIVEARVRRVQFHPSYGYEDFIRGLQLDNGRTIYKNGVLLQVLEEMKSAGGEMGKDLPFVMILDEMNRADLSKVLGECFSLLEDRENKILLAGQDDKPLQLVLPSNLYFIGTMNLIDQSLEQVDFALRRRFLWFFRGFERSALINLIKVKWGKFPQTKKRPWSRVEEEFELLAERCVILNKMISNFESLGNSYEIGHTYFSDVVAFAQDFLLSQPNSQKLLWNKSGQAKGPVVTIWNYSLAPLLEQYLSGVDKYEREAFLFKVKQGFLEGKL